ncbi:PAS domain-containing protein [Pacificimonas flava]|uniref:Sensory box histidine kinase n=1 Tax=Pacificimonas flava TaxID=1234595 RepID=M2U2Y4_9SPHN|nr:PAS domain-containing protein [Pacificimonas flava]EMD82233.1 Sensory box histidine kinase [Pacificimonas flava]MBB5280856.1 PAS domain S-box-containing protein [Pacificimonas flava]
MHDGNKTDDPSLTSEILDGHFRKAAISVLPFALTISNPRIDDNPLVYVSPAFCRITGYAKESCVGRNCRFLQGANTHPDAVAAIREGIEKEREVNVDLLNYRADGTEFWNRLLLAPLFDDDGELAYFMGIQHELRDAPKQQNANGDETVLEELQHRVKNHLAMVVSMIRMQSRSEQAGSDYKTLARRVETLQLLYQELSDAGVARHNSDMVPLGAYISRVASAVSHLDGRESIRVNIDADEIDVESQRAGQFGLIVSELLTNALQHAFEDQRNGLVTVQLKQLTNGVVRLRVSDDGAGIPQDVEWPRDGNLGGRIVQGLVNDLGALLSVDRGGIGTSVTLDLPAR